MKKRATLLFLFLCLMSIASAQNRATVTINADKGQYEISRHIYGHFSEPLGHCIYDGRFVGENSNIPNTGGVRNDIIDALKSIKIPNLRWPGGCFADEYHWMDGIGPKESRKKMVNTSWGGVVEDNSFGTHEFMNLCEVLETEPYVCGNVGSGTVEEMAKWVEYMTMDGESPMAKLRRENGRDKPWKLQFFGVGNENWGCGGSMTAQYYTDLYRRYQTFVKNYGDNRILKIAGGPSSGDTHWMDVLMKGTDNGQRWGVSLHHYTVADWGKKGSATEFDEWEYFKILHLAYYMDELIKEHSAVMDKYDPEKKTALAVDEWGNWYEVEPGTNPGFLYQQNTLRDAITAAVTLNIFNNHADRVRMANIAQIVNVLQALFLTEGEKMILTPTFHIFDMYKVHHDATLLPVDVNCMKYELNHSQVEQLSVSSSRDKNGVIHISIVNVDPTKTVDLSCVVNGVKVSKVVESSVITASTLNTYNSFDNPGVIKKESFKDAKLKGGELTVTLPAKSIVTISLR